MSSPPLSLSSHARTLARVTTGAAACLLHRRGRHLVVRGLSEEAAAAAASPGIACCHHSSMAAAPSPRASSFSSPPRAGGLVVLAVTASAVAVSVCWVFFSAIRSMLAWKKEAEFLQKYFDSVREKLPENMASVRLVGREVGALAADLTDLSQDLTKGVKSSMGIVHATEAQLRQLTPSSLPGTAQRMPNRTKAIEEPLLASTVRDLRELIADLRSGFGAAFGMAGLLMWASNFGSKSRKNRS